MNAPTRRFLVRYINFTNTSFHFVGSRRANIDCSSKAVVRDAFPESRKPVQSKTHLHNHPISSCYLRVRKQNGVPAKIRSWDLVFLLFKAIFDSAAWNQYELVKGISYCCTLQLHFSRILPYFLQFSDVDWVVHAYQIVSDLGKLYI